MNPINLIVDNGRSYQDPPRVDKMEKKIRDGQAFYNALKAEDTQVKSVNSVAQDKLKKD